MPGLTIHGGGIAACCVARLAKARRWQVTSAPGAKPGGPTLLVNESTSLLLSDVFGTTDGLFTGGVEILQRIVRWGPNSDTIELPHRGDAIDETLLLRRLWTRLDEGMRTLKTAADAEANWNIYTTLSSAPCMRQGFGTRTAAAVPVDLRHPDAQACWVEATRTGWLFLLPCGGGRAALLATGAAVDELLRESILIAPQVAAVHGPGTTMSTAPSIAETAAADGWVACGSAAMSLDPICGEGAGNSVREAILATAVVAAIERGAPARLALAHYQERLLAGFLRHLTVSRRFYSTGGTAGWWQEQTACIDRGIAWTQQRLAELPPPTYRLNGFELRPLR